MEYTPKTGYSLDIFYAKYHTTTKERLQQEFTHLSAEEVGRNLATMNINFKKVHSPSLEKICLVGGVSGKTIKEFKSTEILEVKKFLNTILN